MNGLSLEIVLELAKAGNEAAMSELFQRVYSKYVELEGKPIRVNEAAKSYGTTTDFWRGVIKAERVKVLKEAGVGGRGNASELDARDVAVFWELYNLLRTEGYLLNKVYRTASTQAIAA